MSEVRLQSAPTLYTSYQPPFLGGAGGLTSSSALLPGPLDGGQCLVGTPQGLFSPNAAYVSNPTGSASLTQMQSDTAASITGGSSGNSQAGSFDLRLRSEQSARLLQSVGETGAIWAPKGGAFDLSGKAGGAIANALALPAAFDNANKEFAEGNTAGGLRHTFSGFSNATQVASNLGAGVENYVRGRGQQAARTAINQAAPKSSAEVVKAATEKAAQMAIDDAKAKAARRGVTEAAETAAKQTSTLAKGAGVGAGNRALAKTVLAEGGEAAAKAATKAVAKTGLKTAAKAAGRFVPGANVAIAALDTATAAATLADPKANLGQKTTACITAAGSILAATNIPVVSQVGAAVSAVSSFIGSFF
jgi:hypothetical protein